MSATKTPSLGRLIGRGAAWSGLNAVVLRLGSFVMGIVVARILDPTDFGIFAVALTVYGIVVNLSELGVSAALIREPKDVDELAPTVFTIALGSSSLLGLAMFVTAPMLAEMLGSAAAAPTLRVLSLTVVLSGFTALPHALLVRRFQQEKRFFIDGASFLVANGLLIVLALNGSGAMALAWSRVLGLVVEAILLFIVVPDRYLPGFKKKVARQLLRFGLPLTGASIVGFLIGNSDYVIVGHSLGATSLGLYLLAYNIAGWPISVLTGIVGGVAMPTFARVQHDAKRLSHSAANALSLLASIAFPVSALLFALAEPLVICVYGSKWSGAVIALRALALFGALRVPIDLFNSVLTASGRTRALLSIQIGWLVALLPLLIVGVDRYGIEGAGLAHVVVSALVVLPAYLLILRRAGVQSRPLAGAVVRPAIASLVAGAAAYAIAGSGSSWTVLMVGGSAGAGAYLLVVGPWIRRVINQARELWGSLPGDREPDLGSVVAE